MAKPRQSEEPRPGGRAAARGARTGAPPTAGAASASAATPAGVAAVVLGPVPSTGLARLLRARSFSAPGLPEAALGRLQAGLRLVGGELVEGGALSDAWIGAGPPPGDRPAIATGDEAGALGPRSFGFLNNVDGVAAYLAPLPARPRRGGVALVVPRRDALPEMLPLLLSRRLAISWLISVGDGDPAEAVQLLCHDPQVSGVLLALGRGARAATLQRALGDKPVILLEPAGAGREAALCRAVVRRAGGVAVSSLEDWLAHGALLESAAHAEAGPAPRPRLSVLVVGGGLDGVTQEAARAHLPTPTALCDIDEPEALAAALPVSARGDGTLTVLCAPEFLTCDLPHSPGLVTVDPAQPERLRALFGALSRLCAPGGRGAEAKGAALKVDRERVASILADLPPPLYVGGSVVSEELLSDHDSKRLLHAYGAKVTRQAPASNITAALRVAAKIGLPVVLSPASVEASDKEARDVACHSQADLKRQATVLLGRAPHIMVKELFPDAPRLTLLANLERGLGTVLRAGPELAVLPLTRGDARELAEALVAPHGLDARGLQELLLQLSLCLSEQLLRTELEIYLADQPVVTAASGVLRRPAP